MQAGPLQNEAINRIGGVHQYLGGISETIPRLGTRSSKVLGLEERSKQDLGLVLKSWSFLNFISSSTFHVAIKQEAVPFLNLIILSCSSKNLSS